MPRYTYGDSELAARRLTLVAEAFDASSRSFLRQVTPAHPALALDLGCGPGHTTTMVHEVSGATRTIGLDRSDAFIGRARAAAPPGVAFVAHDVTQTPFPVDSAALVYARLLLAHIPEPASVLARWSTTLTIGGRLVIDDLEAIVTETPVFRRYLDEVAIPVVRRQGGHLLVGPALHACADPPGLTRIHDATAAFTPEPATTARIFSMNLAVLVDRDESPARPDLAEALDAVATGAPAPPVRWVVRQIAYERVVR